MLLPQHEWHRRDHLQRSLVAHRQLEKQNYKYSTGSVAKMMFGRKPGDTNIKLQKNYCTVYTVRDSYLLYGRLGAA